MQGLVVPVIVLALGLALIAGREKPRPAPEPVSSAMPAPSASLTPRQIYAPIIGACCTALAEGWDEARLAEAGMSPLMTGCGEVPLESIGYAVIDLDGDGAQELLLFTGTGDNRWYYAGGIRFANLGATAFDCDFVTTLKLERREMVDMTYTTDPADYVQLPLMPLAQWTALPPESDAP